jgi:2-polyprenyl-3-methyl-5-hydroxy-6-metoxy-1,4-benzoquinol methylase
MREKLSCLLSKSENFKKIYSIKNFPIYMGISKIPLKYKFQDLNWWINRKSGNVQIHPKISLEKLYHKSHGSGTVGKIWSDHHIFFFSLLKPYIRGNICEIGGGNNSILIRIKNFTKINNFYSFDKNLKIKKKNKKIFKIKNFFNTNFFKNKVMPKFDLVVHSHTFEHIYDPVTFLRTIKFILAENGKHIFTMPNMGPMIKKGYANAMNFEHPFFYDQKLVEALLHNNNFEIIKKKYFKKDHSIMYVTKVTKVLKFTEYSQYLKNLKIFKTMFNLWKKDIKIINKTIFKSDKVFIFGAHIFSQMILFNGLNKKNVLGILDNDFKKNNNYLYGTKYKIFSPTILKNFLSPTVILRAGPYNAEIKRQIFLINPSTIIV